MKVVIDTNVLLISLPKQSPYRPIFQGILNGEFILVLSNDILMEYEEIIARQVTPVIAKNIIKLLLALPNTIFQDIYFKWNLIDNDPDDNKFIDCAIAAGAKYIVTEDKHFRSVSEEEIFSVEIINSDNFVEILKIL